MFNMLSWKGFQDFHGLFVQGILGIEPESRWKRGEHKTACRPLVGARGWMLGFKRTGHDLDLQCAAVPRLRAWFGFPRGRAKLQFFCLWGGSMRWGTLAETWEFSWFIPVAFVWKWFCSPVFFLCRFRLCRPPCETILGKRYKRQGLDVCSGCTSRPQWSAFSIFSVCGEWRLGESAFHWSWFWSTSRWNSNMSVASDLFFGRQKSYSSISKTRWPDAILDTDGHIGLESKQNIYKIIQIQ